MSCEPKSTQWLTKHLSTIGGSNAAAAVGRSRWKSPRELYNEMARVLDGTPPEPREPNDHMRRGILLEPLARQLLAERIGCEIVPHDQDDFRIDGGGYAHALPDGWAINEIVELKAPMPATCSRVALEGLPAEWQIQGLHNMACTGARLCIFGILDPITVSVQVVELERDDVLIAALMKAEREFYDKVLARTPPDDDAEPAAVLPEYDGELVRLTSPEAEAAAVHLLRCRELTDDAKGVLDDAKRRLIQLAGEAQVFEIPGVARCYNRPRAGRRMFNAAAAQSVYPDLKDDEFYKTAKPSRPFLIYPI